MKEATYSNGATVKPVDDRKRGVGVGVLGHGAKRKFVLIALALNREDFALRVQKRIDHGLGAYKTQGTTLRERSNSNLAVADWVGLGRRSTSLPLVSNKGLLEDWRDMYPVELRSGNVLGTPAG